MIKINNTRLKDKRGVIHIGAHFGQEREWYQINEFEPVIWIEADPESYKILSENIKNFPNHTAYNIGIYHKNVTMPFHISSNDGMSSSILDFKTHKDYYPEIDYVKDILVDFIRMDDFIKKYNININDYNFLNLDVQGVELQVLQSFGNLITKFDYIYTEVNLAETYKNCALMLDLDMYLSNYNFVRKDTTIFFSQYGEALYIKNS